jgi:hypothetical protein
MFKFQGCDSTECWSSFLETTGRGTSNSAIILAIVCPATAIAMVALLGLLRRAIVRNGPKVYEYLHQLQWARIDRARQADAERKLDILTARAKSAIAITGAHEIIDMADSYNELARAGLVNCAQLRKYSPDGTERIIVELTHGSKYGSGFVLHDLVLRETYFVAADTITTIVSSSRK